MGQTGRERCVSADNRVKKVEKKSSRGLLHLSAGVPGDKVTKTRRAVAKQKREQNQDRQTPDLQTHRHSG